MVPYGVRGVIWYQGEDDDARGWHAFYDESMKALIQAGAGFETQNSFLQVELAPLHEGLGKALNYAVIREKQRDVMDALPGVQMYASWMQAMRATSMCEKRPVGRTFGIVGKKICVWGNGAFWPTAPACAVPDGRTVRSPLNFCTAAAVFSGRKLPAGPCTLKRTEAWWPPKSMSVRIQ